VPIIISECRELIKLCHINCSGLVTSFETHCSEYTVSFYYINSYMTSNNAQLLFKAEYVNVLCFITKQNKK